MILWMLLGAFALLFAAAASVGAIMSRVERPKYRLDASEGSIEVRSYAPMIAAETETKGARKAAINEGFRVIAAYIFGANKPKTKIGMTAPVQQQRQTIAMTAPVQQQRQTIAMTAPVTQQVEGNRWVVRFLASSRRCARQVGARAGEADGCHSLFRERERPAHRNQNR